jgi:glycosyltransferase involved in cell wall biosynthesis
VWFSRAYVPIDDLLEAIAHADAGVVAMRRDAFRDLTHCNKMFDFISMRVPVLMSRTRSVQAYFDRDCFEFFESGDHVDLAEGIRRLHDDPERRRRLVAHASKTVEPYRWERQCDVYLDHIGELIAPAYARA